MKSRNPTLANDGLHYKLRCTQLFMFSTKPIMGWYWICNNSQDRFQLQLSRIVNCKLPKMDIGRFPLRKQHGKLNVFSCEPPPQTGCFCGTPGRGDEVAKDTILSFLLSVFHTRCHCARHCKPRLSCSRRDCAALQTGLSHALRLLGRYFSRSVSVSYNSDLQTHQ